MKNINKQYGFSLVELVVVVAILGILYAVAYPSYLGSVRKTNRAEAKAELSDAAQRFQRCYTVNGRFDISTTGNCKVYDQLTTGSKKIISRGQGFYEITLMESPAISKTTFKLVATAVKAPQTKDTKDDCDKLKLDQNGTKEPAACW